MFLEFFLERSEAAIALLGKFFDRDVVEDVFVDGLFEALLHHIGIVQYFALETAVALRHDQVDQFCHFQIFGSGVLGEDVFADVLIDRAEEIACCAPCWIDHMVVFAAIFATVVIFDTHTISHVEMCKDVA